LGQLCVFENIEHAGCGGHGFGFQHALQILAEFGLRVQLLERTQASEHPVAIFRPEVSAITDGNAGCDDEHFAAQLPGYPEGLPPFIQVFDDVQDVAEIYGVGWVQ